MTCLGLYQHCIAALCEARCDDPDAPGCAKCTRAVCDPVFARCSGLAGSFVKLGKKEPKKTFDFVGCTGGSDAFEVTLLEQGGIYKIGDISPMQVGLRVQLEADNDLDIMLFDLDDKSQYAEGKAIVGWCDTQTNPDCNLGVSSAQKVDNFVYKDMPLNYSGYDGLGGGKKGHEYLYITGPTTVKVGLSAYAFEPGKVKVSYSWESTATGCCLGIEACGGEFSSKVEDKAYITVGEIPPGKIDVEVRLSAWEDIDVQLYDLDDTSIFEEGQAIIAYCDDSDDSEVVCNRGLLGNNQGEMSTMYKGLEYTYSGYDGTYEGGLGRKGNEFIRITGKSNTNLVMKAYGYAPGKATISYTYFEARRPGPSGMPVLGPQERFPAAGTDWFGSGGSGGGSGGFAASGVIDLGGSGGVSGGGGGGGGTTPLG